MEKEIEKDYKIISVSHTYHLLNSSEINSICNQDLIF